MKMPRATMVTALVLLAGLCLQTCGELDRGGVGTSQMPTVYGTRDQHEYYEASGPTAAALFDAEVVLVRKTALTASGAYYNINVATTLAAYKAPLCPDEPFASQPTTGFCSGFKVGDNLVVTAGHCITNKRDCSTTAFVFGFRMADASTVVSRVPASDVYSCSAIVGRVQTSTNDWAVIKVDRAIAGHGNLPLRRSGAVQSDPLVAGLQVIGHPVGLPTKLADNASVRSAMHADYFEANLDTFGGNSGSAVVSVDAAGNLLYVEGILVRGNSDWEYDAARACNMSVFCDDTGCTGTDGAGWEEVTRTVKFASLVPAPPVCGDGACNGTDTCSSCPADCGACPVCGDGVCNGSETNATCPADCTCAPRTAACSTNAECCSGVCSLKTHRCK